MALREYLVSYGVQVDEAAVERLFSVLDEDRARAGEVTAAFTALDAAVKAFAESAASLGSMDRLKKSGILSESELKKLTPVLKVKADTADFLKNAEEALNQARSMAAGMMLTVPVKLMPDMSAFEGLSAPGGGGGSIGGAAPKGGGTGDSLHITVETVGGSTDGLAQTVADALERRLGGGGYA